MRCYQQADQPVRSLRDGAACALERAAFRYGMRVDPELLRYGIRAQSRTQSLGDLLLQRRIELGSADAHTLRLRPGHAGAGALAVAVCAVPLPPMHLVVATGA